MTALVRIAYRSCYLLTIAAGTVAARLAADFHELGAAGSRFGPFLVVVQMPIFVCWLVARPISLAAFAGCCALAPRLQASG
jgi:hypothetical protein